MRPPFGSGCNGTGWVPPSTVRRSNEASLEDSNPTQAAMTTHRRDEFLFAGAAAISARTQLPRPPQVGPRAPHQFVVFSAWFVGG